MPSGVYDHHNTKTPIYSKESAELQYGKGVLRRMSPYENKVVERDAVTWYNINNYP